MTEVRRLSLADLRNVVSDAGELAKGAKIFDDGGLLHLSRHQEKLFADAKGSGAAPYKVQAIFADGGTIRGRCSCMAARSRPFCKHGAALLVAWARAPESFAESAGPPAGSEGPAQKKKSVKKGQVDDGELMGRGVRQVSTLIRELAVSGVASIAADRVEQVRALGASLREAKLRRLSARTLELCDHLGHAAARGDAFEPNEYAELLGDMLLTARKLEKHLAGEAIADEHVEELIGKTWTKKDRTPIAGLELVEYAFTTRFTSDEFTIRESRFLDLATGEHYSEKQILPAFLAKRTAPKPSHAGKLLSGAAGSLYPSFAPRRLDLAESANEVPITSAMLAQLVDKAVPTVSAAIASLQERKKDVFAPEALPVALRTELVLAAGARLQIADASGMALYLPDEGEAADSLAIVLRGVRLLTLIGDVALDGVLPTLFPLAAVVEDRAGLTLLPLSRSDASAVLTSKKVRAAKAAREQHGRAAKWIDVARAVGASVAATALGELREEMAGALANGLATVLPRATDPLSSRLRELSLGKQAELLDAVARRSDAAEKLDDFVKLHQVLGIALSRLAGAARVDLSVLEPVPSYPSVHVARAERVLPPSEVAALQGEGRLNRYEAAIHYGRHYASVPIQTLAEEVYPTWADGSASSYIAAALVNTPEAAVAAAERVLTDGPRTGHWMRRTTARVAKLTAVRVLGAVATPEAKKLLSACLKRRESDPALAAHAQRALQALAGTLDDAEQRERERELCFQVLNASSKDQRINALRALAYGAHVGALPVLRASFAGDISRDVRDEAAMALATLGDVDSVESFVRLLRNRKVDLDDGRTGARALGTLGDVRGLDELLRAFAEAWNPTIIAEALNAFGPSALDGLVRAIEQDETLASRKATTGVIAAMPAADVVAYLGTRLETDVWALRFCVRAELYLAMTKEHREAIKLLVVKISELRPAILDPKKASAEERALARKCARYG